MATQLNATRSQLLLWWKFPSLRIGSVYAARKMKSMLTCFTVLSLVHTVVFSCDPGYYSHEESCIACPPGTYQPESGQNGCKPCPSAEFQSQSGSTSCAECGPNSMPNENSSACDCKPGSVRNSTTDQCILCPPGTRFRETDYLYLYGPQTPVCEPCRGGTFQPNRGQSECISCPDRSYSLSRASNCTVCPHGEVPIQSSDYYFYNSEEAESVMCGTCPAGMEYGEYSNQCSLCRDMYFKAEEGQEPCLPCPPHTSSTEDRTACTPCEPGTALMEDGSCGKCPAGSFYGREPLYIYPVPSPLPNISYCFACQPGTFTNYDNVMQECFTCAGHSFSGVGATECVKCPQNQVLMSNGSCSTCQPGTSYDVSLMECMPCLWNQYTRNANERYCRSCAEDSYSYPGSTTCTPLKCEEGTIFVHQTGSCGVCPPGTSPYGIVYNVCQNCSVGSVKPYAGNNFCDYCSLGQTSNEDFTECVDDPDYDPQNYEYGY